MGYTQTRAHDRQDVESVDYRVHIPLDVDAQRLEDYVRLAGDWPASPL